MELHCPGKSSPNWLNYLILDPKLGIPVEVVPALVADSPQETARDVALSAYYRRQAAAN